MKWKTLKSLWWIVGLQYKTAPAAFVWNYLYDIFTGISSIITTFVVAKLITSVTEVAFNKTDTSDVYMWLVILLVFEVLNSVLRSINKLIDNRTEQKMDLATNELFFNKIYELSQEQFEDEKFNTVLARAREALLQIRRTSNEISWALSSLVTFIAAITAIVVVSPIVGLVIIVIIIPIARLRVKQNKLYEETYKKSEPIERVSFRTRWLLIDPNSMPEIRIVNGFSHLVSIWRKNMKKSQRIYFDNEKKVLKYEISSELIQPFVNFLANIYFFRLLVAGTLGLDRFIFLRGILEQASSSAVSLATSFDTLHELKINLDNFSQVGDTKPAIPNGKIAVTAPLSIEFKSVHFAYPDTDADVLSDISFRIFPGSKLALVGENGAGKTTLIKLLLRQYLPTKGQIIVNGHNIKDIEQTSYYHALSILSQEFLIVNHLTIRENLLLGVDRGVSDEDIYQNTDLVGATGFLKKLPNKLDQRLDSSFKDGSNLSGGQLQRLGVARALIRNGDVMILDEPTSAIDAKAEYDIFNNIYKAHAHRTTLIVSHRFSTVRKADRVIVMEQGKIIEYGSHEELIKNGGLYKEMFEIQAEGYK